MIYYPFWYLRKVLLRAYRLAATWLIVRAAKAPQRPDPRRRKKGNKYDH